jgi:hypothetical protein
VEHVAYFLSTQDDGQTGLLAGADQLLELADLSVQHVTIQKEHGAEGLRLRTGADVLAHGEVSDEGVDLGLGHLAGMTEPMEADEPPHPQAVGLFGAATVVAGAQGALELVDELRHGSRVAAPTSGVNR